MLDNIYKYKGYYTKIEFSAEDKVLHGKIEGIRDLVTFEAVDAVSIEKEFRNAVDDYLQFCKDVGKNPDINYSGTFNVRLPKEMHRELTNLAFAKKESLNSIMVKAATFYVLFEQKKRTKEKREEISIDVNINNRIAHLFDMGSEKNEFSKIISSTKNLVYSERE